MEYKEYSKSLLSIKLDKIDLQWTQILSEGWASPLYGFMKENEYLQTLHFNSITFNKTTYNFSIPIVLSIPEELKVKIESQTHIKSIDVSLTYQDKIIGLLLNCEIFPHRKEERCSRQFGINSLQHPTINVFLLIINLTF